MTESAVHKSSVSFADTTTNYQLQTTNYQLPNYQLPNYKKGREPGGALPFCFKNNLSDYKTDSAVCLGEDSGIAACAVGALFSLFLGGIAVLLGKLGLCGIEVELVRREVHGADYVTALLNGSVACGVLVKKLNLENKTGIKTVGNIVPDCWVYVQDHLVKMGRFQIYNNWSPYMVKDLENTVWIGLEYFCNEGDELWNMTEDQFAGLGINEMIAIGLIQSREDVLDWHMEKVKKAYPAYFDTYAEIGTLIEYLNSIDNLYCVGRNGQHRYNNLDHSMMTAFAAVDCILTGNRDKSAIWNVNTEKEYHEEKA